MGKNILIINPGSASYKYALYSIDKGVLITFHIENEDDNFICTIKTDNGIDTHKVAKEDLYIQIVINKLIDLKYINTSNDIDLIGIRIVAPGKRFTNHQIIDDSFLDDLLKARQIAPLHIDPVIKEISNIKMIIPDRKIICLSDSNFHNNLNDIQKIYNLPKKLTNDLELYRFGYHGLSIESIVNKLENHVPHKVIICHLGGGCSITALLDGKSIDTSMGFTPLEGVTMSTRIGDIDAGAVLYLSKKYGNDYLEDLFYYKSGLLGISDTSSDIRTLLDLQEQGNIDAKRALDKFIYDIKKYIGSYIAILNGLDLLVFSGTIGVRSHIMRSKICNELNFLGISIDEEKNQKVIERDDFINNNSSLVKVKIINTQEIEQMGKIAQTFL